MKSYNQLLLSNKIWAKEVKDNDESFFENLSFEQKPKYLWIGCSDSRVPESEITATEQGDFFVHRNIGNIADPNDPNFMSVLKYAVDYLKIKHIVVCGHYKCGGINAAIGNIKDEYLNNWLADTKSLYQKHKSELEKINNEEERANSFSEISALHQAEKIHETSVVKNAKQNGQRLFVHAWVFNIYTGELKVLNKIDPEE